MFYESIYCQKCGEMLGWLGRNIPLHNCKKDKQEPVDLESALESLVNLCNNDPLYCNTDEVIKAEAALERLYKSRGAPSK